MATKKKSVWGTILLVLLGIFVLIQFFNIDKTNPQTDAEKDYLVATNAPEDVRQIMHSACYDCHSNETVYPWYSGVEPVSWLLKWDIDEAREHLNFSVWTEFSSDKQGHSMEHAVEMVKEDEMPLWRYRLMHQEARLSDDQKETLTQWFNQVREENHHD